MQLIKYTRLLTIKCLYLNINSIKDIFEKNEKMNFKKHILENHSSFLADACGNYSFKLYGMINHLGINRNII